MNSESHEFIAKNNPLNSRSAGIPILRVRDLHTYFYPPAGILRAVEGVSFSLGEGETLGLVGESGCGKTVTALSLLRLVPPPGRIVRGEIVLEGKELRGFSAREMRRVRGKEIAMIFQEPMTSLNPVFTIGDQIIEAIQAHQRVSRKEARLQAAALLESVDISEAEKRLTAYPHQFSGGMRQRVMIAMALSCHPRILIADEPTTALDVTVQARILSLLARLRDRLGMALLLVTHDMGVIAQVTDRVAVMYLGRVVESASTAELFARPLHPYTRGLLKAIPRSGDFKERLETIPGSVPDLLHRPEGCAFHPRCRKADEICRRKKPLPREVYPGHLIACHHPGG